MHKAALLAGVFSALTFSAVQAADIEAPPEAYDWTGFYIGLQAGYAWGDFDVTTFTDAGDHAPDSDGGDDIDGFIGGAHVGGNIQFDSIVFGIEADINAADVDGTFTFDNDDDFSAEINWEGDLRARLGFAFDRALIYATGGVAIADVDLGTFNAAPVPINESTSETYVGYTVGGGIEYAFTDSLSARIEYRYTDLGEENFDWDEAFPAFNGDYEIDYHMVQGGLSWHL